LAAEGNLRKKLKARVEAYGGEVRAVAWLGRKNAPDVLCLFDPPMACHVFVETKGVEKPSEAQLREHVRMREAGCEVIVCLNERELDKWLPPIA
jgi:hypothetical protein